MDLDKYEKNEDSEDYDDDEYDDDDYGDDGDDGDDGDNGDNGDHKLPFTIDFNDPFGLNNNGNKTSTTTNSITSNSNNESLNQFKSYVIPSTANLSKTLEQLESDKVFLEQLHKKFSDQLDRLKVDIKQSSHIYKLIVY
ncbi:hypothetical protein DICPUDRAFT_154250 [Dictyostelium purpureum]|uniref:Uncharacterized protein n=1 Tax=Dictyostelium purpureum TaxID=5786 RepID=F0ZQU9_DICPU|nr:uncharacterized protein DICPUDRAFT_154250 [Dictyostelium purpureum]EGC33681.1 hypothetical protein DICPUDRAFT_154250 [Dictyostelium purpureum]|eukprot:XP_003289800.1 hypothetical protein DICPUDRAFT_154250 [Dictyostelium purpureum]